jgi:hypothetical protein
MRIKQVVALVSVAVLSTAGVALAGQVTHITPAAVSSGVLTTHSRIIAELPVSSCAPPAPLEKQSGPPTVALVTAHD